MVEMIMLCIVCYESFVLGINLFFSCVFLDIWDRIAIQIKIKIPERFKTKVDPIYELYEDDYGFYVRKFSLKYTDEKGSFWELLCFIIPWPTNILTYGYVMEGEFLVCKNTEEELFKIDKSPKELYESKYAVEIVKSMTEDALLNKKQNRIDQWNKIFNKNYE